MVVRINYLIYVKFKVYHKQLVGLYVTCNDWYIFNLPKDIHSYNVWRKLCAIVSELAMFWYAVLYSNKSALLYTCLSFMNSIPFLKTFFNKMLPFLYCSIYFQNPERQAAFQITKNKVNSKNAVYLFTFKSLMTFMIK